MRTTGSVTKDSVRRPGSGAAARVGPPQARSASVSAGESSEGAAGAPSAGRLDVPLDTPTDWPPGTPWNLPSGVPAAPPDAPPAGRPRDAWVDAPAVAPLAAPLDVPFPGSRSRRRRMTPS